MARKTTNEEIIARLSNKRAFIVKKQTGEGGPVSRWVYIASSREEVDTELSKDTLADAVITIEGIYPAIIVL